MIDHYRQNHLFNRQSLQESGAGTRTDFWKGDNTSRASFMLHPTTSHLELIQQKNIQIKQEH